jgi:hypothetical protein
VLEEQLEGPCDGAVGGKEGEKDEIGQMGESYVEQIGRSPRSW